MVDAESTDLVCIDQYLTKCRNCLRPNCWENCLGRFDFSVSTFQRIWIFHSPIKSKNPRVVFQALFRSGSELLHIYLIEKLFLSFEVGFFFFAICYCLGWRTRGSIYHNLNVFSSGVSSLAQYWKLFHSVSRNMNKTIPWVMENDWNNWRKLDT